MQNLKRKAHHNCGKRKIQFHTLFFALSCCFSFCILHFTLPQAFAQNTPAVETIVKQVNDILVQSTPSQVISGRFDGTDVIDQFDENTNQIGNCAAQVEVNAKVFVSRFIDYFDFKASFDDIFKRNQCLRQDVWLLEDTLTQMSNAMDELSFDCSDDANVKMEQLQRQYRVTEVQLDFFRKYGTTKVADGTNLQATVQQALELPQYDDLTDEMKQRVLAVEYAHPQYRDFDKNTNPQGCQDGTFEAYFKPVIDRWQRIRQKTVELGDAFDFSSGAEKRRERARAKARAWFNNFNFGVFRVGSVTQLENQNLIDGKASAADRIRGALDGFVNLGEAGVETFLAIPQPKIADLIEESQVPLTFNQVDVLLRKKTEAVDRENTLDALKRLYYEQYKNSSAQIYLDMQNQLIQADNCIRKSYIEDDETLLCETGEESLPTFEKALDNMLSKQCIRGFNGSQCILPPEWINRVKP